MNDPLTSLPILLKNPQILIVGGGSVALHKTRVLLENGITFRILSETFLREFDELPVSCTQKTLETADLACVRIIVDASGSDAVKKIIAEEKQKRCILVNCVDDPESSDFFFSSLLSIGRLKIAVSSDGASPTITQVVRDKIRSVIPVALADLLEKKYQERKLGIIDKTATKNEAEQLLTTLAVIPVGTSAPETLPLKTAQALFSAEVVFHDAGVPAELLALTPVTAERILVSEELPDHTGKRAVYLKDISQ